MKAQMHKWQTCFSLLFLHPILGDNGAVVAPLAMPIRRNNHEKNEWVIAWLQAIDVIEPNGQLQQNLMTETVKKYTHTLTTATNIECATCTFHILR